MPDLLDLAHQVQDAVAWAEDAIATASEFCADPDTGEPVGWKAMEEAADTLGKALALLKTALDPLKDAIEAEREWQDEMEDKHDAQSY